MKQLRLVVVGTGTEIGKTHASITLLHALRSRRYAATGLKPVESGVGTDGSDTSRLAAASSEPPHLPPPFAFSDAVSPHLAARRAGTTIDLSRILGWISGHPSPALVVETAGALLSPLSPSLTNLQLVDALHPTTVVLIAPDRLGALHEVSSAMAVLHALAPALPPPLVFLQPPSVGDPSTGTNAEELQALGIVDRAWRLTKSTDPAANIPLALAALDASGCFT